MKVNEERFNYDCWPFEQGPFHIVLSKKIHNEYIILKNSIMNSFYGKNSFKDFVCHFVGNGSNFDLIHNQISDFNDVKKLKMLSEHKHNSVFLNQPYFLEYRIYSTSDSFLLKYDWDFSQVNVECLSHSFKIKTRLDQDYKIINFGSNANGYFEFHSMEMIELYHSYDWHGEKNWIQINC